MSLDVTSSAFEHEQPIPSRYTCDGQDVSPPLEWTAGPMGTESYALIMDDPDAPAGTWVHWIAWNIKGTTLPEDEAKRILEAMETKYADQNSAAVIYYLMVGPPRDRVALVARLIEE